MAAGLLGVRMAIVKVRLAKDYNTELEHVHHPNHREMAPTVQEAHSRQDNAHCLNLVVISYNVNLLPY